MSALTFDTYKAIQSLMEKGVDQKQAEGITEVIQQAQEAHLEQLSTKGDIAEVKSEIIRIEGRLNLIQWMLGITLAGVMALLLKSFFSIG